MLQWATNNADLEVLRLQSIIICIISLHFNNSLC